MSTLSENTTGSEKNSPERICPPYNSCLVNKNTNPTPTKGPRASSTNVSIGISLRLVGSANTNVFAVAARITEVIETRMR